MDAHKVGMHDGSIRSRWGGSTRTAVRMVGRRRQTCDSYDSANRSPDDADGGQTVQQFIRSFVFMFLVRGELADLPDGACVVSGFNKGRFPHWVETSDCMMLAAASARKTWTATMTSDEGGQMPAIQVLSRPHAEI